MHGADSMTKRLLPRMIVGGLLVGSFLAWAANGLSSQTVTDPTLCSIAKQAPSQQAGSPQLVSQYVDTLVAQQKMKVLQERLSFYKDTLKQAKSNAGIFSHLDANVEQTLDTDINLARAAYFGAKSEWKLNLNTLNQFAGQYYEEVKPISENFYVEKSSATRTNKSVHQAAQALEKQRREIDAARKALTLKQYAYNNDRAKITDVTRQGLNYYAAQEKYWRLVSRYLHALVKSDTQNQKISAAIMDRLNEMLYQPQKLRQRAHLVKHRKRRHKAHVQKHKKVNEHKKIVHHARRPVHRIHKAHIIHKTHRAPRKLVALPVPKTVMHPIKTSAASRQAISYVEPPKPKLIAAKVIPLKRQMVAYVESPKLVVSKKVKPIVAAHKKVSHKKVLHKKVAHKKATHKIVKRHKKRVEHLLVLPRPKSLMTKVKHKKRIIIAKHHKKVHHKKVVHVAKAVHHHKKAVHVKKLAHHRKKRGPKIPNLYILPEPNSTRFNYVI